MKARVKLMGRLRVRDAELKEGAEVELADGSTVSDLLRHISLPERNYLVLVNDEPIKHDEFSRRTLNDEDQVMVSSAIKGG